MEMIKFENDSYCFSELKTSGVEDLQEYWCKMEKERKNYLGMEMKSIDKIMNSFENTFRKLIPEVEKELEIAAKHMIGSTIVTPHGSYEITMVEIYADGIWDRTGDYLKNLFKYLNTRTKLKLEKGPRLYFYGGRLDIKVFQENLPFSFLVRNLRKDGKSINQNVKIGSAYPMQGEGGYGQLFWNDKLRLKKIHPDELKLHWDGLQRKSRPVYEEHQIQHSKRIMNGRFTGVGGKYKDKEWNFSLKEL